MTSPQSPSDFFDTPDTIMLNQNTNIHNGQSSHDEASHAFDGTATIWNPAVLLDPQHHALNSAFSSHMASLPPSAPTSVYGGSQMGGVEEHAFAFQTSNVRPSSDPSNDLVFHFAGPGTDDGYLSSGDQINSDFASGDKSLEGLDGLVPPDVSEPVAPNPSSGMASMIERGYVLQDRIDVPEPKRRKVVYGAQAEAKPFGQSASNGILAKAIKDERSGEQRPAAMQQITSSPSHSASAASAAVAVEPEAKPDEKPAAKQESGAKAPVTVDLTEGPENYRKAEDTYEEVCFGSVLGVTVDCHKVPAPKPGSQAMGGPAYWPTVKIMLRRNEGERSNRIFVLDHTRKPFGTLDSRAGECFGTLMDVSKIHLRVAAKIPSRRKNHDEIVGQPISRSYKIDMVIYGASTFGKAIGRRLIKHDLKLVKPNHYDPDIRLAVPEQHLAPPNAASGNAAVLPGRPAASGNNNNNASAAATNNYHASTTLRTMEEIRSEALTVFDSMANAEDLPEMEPASCVITPMLRHQKQALYFMTNREKPLAEQADSKMISSIWKMRPALGNQTLYYNLITQETQMNPPPESLGGILADMMGLGKTLSILSLVATSKPQAARWEMQLPSQPKAPEKKKKPSTQPSFEAPTPHTLDLTKLKKNGRGTLLVCPLSTVANWEEQIKQHLQPGSIKYHIYHGQNRTKNIHELAAYDLVITTYGSVSSELTARSKGKNGLYPLEEVGWFRVVLDEAHMIREPNTLQFKAICRLQANRRWAVTGTPVQNRLEDLGSLLAFLRLKPFDERTKFNQYIVNPFRACDPNILTQLRILVDTITLRRLKDKIDLPPRTDVIAKLTFSPDERRLYDFYAKNAHDRLEVLTHNNDRLLGGKTYIHILQSILRLRLICAHGRDLLNEDDLRVMQGSTLESAITLDDDDDILGEAKRPLGEGEAYSYYDLLVNSDQDKCVHCKRRLGVTDDASAADIRSEKQEDVICYITPCIHAYCPDCIKHFADRERKVTYKSNDIGICPQCSAEVVFTCAEIRHDRADNEDDATGNRGNNNKSTRRGGGGGAKASTPGGGGGGSSSSSSAREPMGKTISEDRYTAPHTKTQALVRELLELKAKSLANPHEPPYKSVVFSGWTAHLDLIQIALKNAGITYCRLDGKMSRVARSQAMETFREDPSVHVILVSIMAGGLGLNLTTGNHVYVMEPQYNPAAEAQAIDRVHRLGQKRPVRTVRYIMQNSFEERMLDIQNRKIKMANLSMDRGDRSMNPHDAARQRLEDLRSLFT